MSNDESLKKLEEIRKTIREKGMAGIEEVFGLVPGTMGGTLPPEVSMDWLEKMNGVKEREMKGLSAQREALIQWFKDTAATSEISKLDPTLVTALISDFLSTYLFARAEGSTREVAKVWAFEEVKTAIEAALKAQPFLAGMFAKKPTS